MGYLGSNATFTGTQNNKRVSVIATQGQTLFTVSGGYAINAIDVYRNGVKLSGQRDFTALDGASVTLVSAANADDILEFITFENFQREDVVTGDGDSVIKGNLQINGNLDAVNGTLTATNLNVSGIYTATQFDGNITGTAATFTGNVTVGGTLTYDDVTNIDSVGLITARNGLQVLAGITTLASQVSIADSIFHTGDTDTAIRFPSANTFTVETAGSEALRVDSNQRLIIGENSSSGLGAFLQVIGDPGAQVHRGVADASGPSITLSKSRNTTYGSFTKLNDDDIVGSIAFRGDDGTDYNSTASLIKAEVDGDTGSNDMPGRLILATTADGAASPTERLRIDSSGTATFSGKILANSGVGFTGFLREGINIVSGKLSDNTTINIDHSMAHYFTTTETTTGIPNFTSTAGINTDLSVGETFSVNVITTAAAAGYSTGARIDAGSTLSVLWNGGSDPSTGGSSGVDVYTYQVIKTGDAAFTVLGNVSNFA